MLTCHFCVRQALSPEQACDDGWAPCYWDMNTDQEIDAPVCPVCQELILVQDEDGCYLPAASKDQPEEIIPDVVLGVDQPDPNSRQYGYYDDW